MLFRTAVLALTLLTVACGSRPPRPPRPPQPPQPPPPVEVRVHVYDYFTPTENIPGALITCAAETGTTNEFGIGYVTLPGDLTSECNVTKDGYDPKEMSIYATTGAEASTWLREVVPPFNGTRNPRHGRLRQDPDCFRDDSGCVVPLYAHAGDLFALYTRDPGRGESELDSIASAGYQGVRTWATLGCGSSTAPNGCGGQYWGGHEVGPDFTSNYWGWVRKFGEALNKRGMRAVWSQGDINQIRDRTDYMRRLAAIDEEVPFIDFIDGGNEAWQTGESDENALARFVRSYMTAGGRGIRSLTSPPGEGKEELDQYSIDPAQIFDVHSFRGNHIWDKIRHIFSITYEAKPMRIFGIGSEPPGNGDLVSVTDNKHELDDEGVPLLATQSMTSRQAFVWFSGEGVKLNKGLRVEAGFWTTPTAVDWLQKDVMTFTQQHHGGSSQGAIRVVGADGQGRVDCRTNGDGRFACTIYGPQGSYRFPVLHSFTGQLCNPGNGVCEPMDKNAGDRLDISFTRGRVLTGRTK